ncbi:MAG: ABC transporter ATP-binding protein/permease [Gammaproteobacteria bacterium]|nr:ABC transporter ATP-binding protein/permease [Gammaproteobacteria bacterium]MDH5730526.1 ABC transporter ATP-binding protein/permease [Gammaproteobacteria bacterium]
MSLFHSNFAALRYFFPHLGCDRKWVLLLSVLIFLLALSNTVLLWWLGKPFDALSREAFDELPHLILVLVLIVCINQALHFCCTFFANWMGLRFVGRLRNRVMAYLLELGSAQAHGFSKGDVLARLSHDVDKVQNLVVEIPSFLISHAATSVLYIFMLFWIDWRLALIALAMLPVLFLHQRLFATPKRKAAEGFLAKNGDLLAHEEEVLNNITEVNAFNAEDRVGRHHQEKFAGAFTWAIKERWLDVSFSASFSLLTYFSAFLIVYMGIKSIEQGFIGLGELLSFILYLGYLAMPVRGFAQLPFQAQADRAAAQRVAEILVLEKICSRPANAPELLLKQGAIRSEAMVFAYPGQKKLFDAVSFEIQAGETIAVVGPSGSGKTTLIKLLAGFFVPQHGRILIDEQDISQVGLKSLRAALSIVWQQPLFFSDSIRNNLLLADANANETQMIEACKAANAWEFIQSLPQQLDSVIGANGVELSVGQRQRLALAQAFLRDTPLLVLDEASSALDSHNEQLIVNSIERLRKNRTTLLIAHRFSSLRSADRVLYFCGDAKVYSGTHEALLASQSQYKEAVTWQLGEP